jgi:hypothetical protein
MCDKRGRRGRGTPGVGKEGPGCPSGRVLELILQHILQNGRVFWAKRRSDALFL